MTYPELRQVIISAVIPALENQVIPLAATVAGFTPTKVDDVAVQKFKVATKLVGLIFTNEAIQKEIEHLINTDSTVMAALADQGIVA